MSASDSSCTRSTQLKGGGDIIIYMIDSTGTVIWENNFGTVDDCFGIKLKLLSDGNFIMLTSSNAGIGFDKTSASYGGDDIWLVKFESNGNIIFDKTYGGDQVERPATIDNQTNLENIVLNKVRESLKSIGCENPIIGDDIYKGVILYNDRKPYALVNITGMDIEGLNLWRNSSHWFALPSEIINIKSICNEVLCNEVIFIGDEHMGRKKINRTENELRELHRKHQRDYYERNKERLREDRMRKYWKDKKLSKV
jgi:hypothetical protein